MYCPQCGIESSTGQQYCRSCGANLKVIAKAVTLSEAIARSDRGPVHKIKEMMRDFKVEQVTEEISRALDQMNKEIARSTPPARRMLKHAAKHEHAPDKPWWLQMSDERTPEQRREEHLVKGTVSLFTGIALMIFLYFFSAALVLKVPPDVAARIPFELEPLIRIAWLIGLVPTLSGLGRIAAGMLVEPARTRELKTAETTHALAGADAAPATHGAHASITESTTELLDERLASRPTNEIRE